MLYFFVVVELRSPLSFAIFIFILIRLKELITGSGVRNELSYS